MEPKRDSKSDERANLELESALRALGAAVYWWNQVLAAEQASDWKPVAPVATGASPKPD